MTVGELAAVGRAAILIPFAAATNNHQELNARVVEHAGGAVVITERELTPERLAFAITEIVTDPAEPRRWERPRRRWHRPTPQKRSSIYSKKLSEANKIVYYQATIQNEFRQH